MMMKAVMITWLIVLESAPEARGQQEQEIHPWLTDCDSYGCFMNYYCNFGVNQSVCETCPDSSAECENLGDDPSLSYNTTEDCRSWCIRGQEGQPCSFSQPCEEGVFFCNFEFGDTGTCQKCKTNVEQCLTADDLTSELGREDCLLCDKKCVPLHFSNTSIDGDDIVSNAMQGSPDGRASGPIVDCTNLIFSEESTCVGADGSVCLVEDYTRNTYYFDVVQKCTKSGGVAVIFYGDFTPQTDNDAAWTGSLSFKDTIIPSVSISYNDGKRLKETKIDSQASVSVSSVGNYCEKRQFCSETIPCIGNSAGKYCDFKWGNGIDDGFCRSCPEDDDGNPNPLGCFFTVEDLGKVTGQKAVESCAETCASSLEFGNCKLCPQNINGFDFGVENESDQCSFCPENDVKYPQNEFPMFGEGIECWQVQKFFESVEVNADAPNCLLAQMMNYICGCEGPGYGGASTDRKRVVLAWLPRVMAILSFLGSSFVVFDASRTPQKRRKVLNQIIISLSAFDMIGSCAYALTTLPIPKYDDIPVYGAKGNDATCTAQGFFIQLGTISCFTNVSLSIYYLLSIKYGRREWQLSKLRLWFLFCPILVGLAFAFGGIPFYGNMILWCNNTASWWPEIPVVLSILLATVVMATVCWDVYWKEKASDRWRGGGVAGAETDGRNRLSSRVFWQSFWYLMAFYLTWPAYLALQYSWAADNYFTRYGLILSAGILVPLQGFWNVFAYVRPRYFNRVQGRSSGMSFTSRLIARSHKTTSMTGSMYTATSRRLCRAMSRKSASTKTAGKVGSDGTGRPSDESGGGTAEGAASNFPSDKPEPRQPGEVDVQSEPSMPDTVE